MRLLLSSLAFLLFPVSGHAARAVMEGIAASSNTVFIDTTTKRVHLSTQAYGDGVSDVSLYTTSNVVVGDGNAIVLFATGSIKVSTISWADGTVSTTASSGGGSSGASLTSTNTWSASQVFGASVTVGPTAYTSTATTGSGATVAAGQLLNGWMVVASTNPSGATASYFYGLQGNREYRIRWPGLLQNTSLGALSVTFNGSSGGTAYSYHVDCSASNGTTDNISSAGGASFVLEGAGAAAARHHKGILEFSSNGTNTMAQTWNTEDVTTSEIMESCTGGAVYASSTVLTSVKLLTSAGTFTGTIYLEELITPLP